MRWQKMEYKNGWDSQGGEEIKQEKEGEEDGSDKDMEISSGEEQEEML